MTKTAIEMITEARALVGTVTAAEAADELAAGTAVLIDVRQVDEWDHGHIDGSVHTPRGLLEFIVDPDQPASQGPETRPRHAAPIVVCASGARAALAAATLTSMGYDDVAVLDGGLKAWIESRAPRPPSTSTPASDLTAPSSRRGGRPDPRCIGRNAGQAALHFWVISVRVHAADGTDLA